jgi:tRNA nucleotidyltransferase (CCA-adding enzyme)
VQFAARFEMTVEPRSVEICRSVDLSDLPRERIWGEWEKLLLKARRPSLGLRVAEDLDVLAKLFPALQTAMQQRGDSLCRALDDAVPEIEELSYAQKVTLMLAVLGSFLGWRGTKELLETLRIFKLDGCNVRAAVIKLVGERKRVSDWFRHEDAIEDQEFRFLAARCEPRMIDRLARARGHHAGAAWFEERMEGLGVLDGPPPRLLQGRHLLEMGQRPGPLIGKIVDAVWIEQLKGNASTLDEARALAQKLIADRRMNANRRES